MVKELLHLCVSKKNEHRVPVVSLSSTTHQLVEFMKLHFGGRVAPKKTYKAHHKKSYHWDLSYQKAVEFLKLIRPYMHEPEKCRRADLLIAKFPALVKRNGKYTPEELAKRHDFEREFFANSPSVKLVDVAGQ